MRKEKEEFTPKELLLLFLPKIWIILLCAVLCAGAIGAYSVFLQDDKYTSSATIYVYKDRGTTDNAQITYYDSITSQKMVKTYSIVLKSRKFLEKVVGEVAETHPDLKWSSIQSALEIKQVDETEVFEVSFTSGDKQLTYDVLTKITELAKIELKNIIDTQSASDVNIIDDPVLPENPDSKNVFRNTLIAFIVGAVLAMIIIFILNQFDVIIHDKKKIGDHFDIPVLGVIPRQNTIAKKSEGRENEV